MRTIVAILIFATAALAQPQYFIATGDTTGYTIQNVFIDFATIDQPQAVGRMALNSVILRDGKLVRPMHVETLSISLPESLADLVLSTAVISDNTPLAQVLVQRLARYAVLDGSLGLPKSVTVKRLDDGALTTLKEYAR